MLMYFFIFLTFLVVSLDNLGQVGQLYSKNRGAKKDLLQSVGAMRGCTKALCKIRKDNTEMSSMQNYSNKVKEVDEL